MWLDSRSSRVAAISLRNNSITFLAAIYEAASWTNELKMANRASYHRWGFSLQFHYTTWIGLSKVFWLGDCDGQRHSSSTTGEKEKIVLSLLQGSGLFFDRKTSKWTEDQGELAHGKLLEILLFFASTVAGCFKRTVLAKFAFKLRQFFVSGKRWVSMPLWGRILHWPPFKFESRGVYLLLWRQKVSFLSLAVWLLLQLGVYVCVCVCAREREEAGVGVGHRWVLGSQVDSGV